MEPRPPTQPWTQELTAIGGAPERYVRINVEKNTKGYQYETTISLRWTDGDFDAEQALIDLLAQSDALARHEIIQRQQADDDVTRLAAA
jgi:hypothetical protein